MTAPQTDRETLLETLRPLTPGGFAEVIRLATPSVAAFATTVVTNLVDTVMVAGVGPGAVGATTTAGIWFHVLAAFFGGLTATVTTFASQSYGRGDAHEAARYPWQGIYLGAVMGLVCLALLPALPGLARLLGHSQTMQEMEVGYMAWRLPSLGLILIMFSMRNFFQGLGRTKLILAVTLCSALANVALNWALIYGAGPLPAMGVPGAGLATLLSIVIGMALYAVPFAVGRTARAARTLTAWRPSWPRFRNLARIGLPTGAQWSLEVVSWAIWHTLLIGRLGQEALDANGVVLEINSAAWFPVIGLGQAACSLVGFYLARGRLDRARRSARTSVVLSIVYMGAISVGFLLGAEHMMRGFFALQRSEADPETVARVVALGATALRIAALWQIFDGISITLLGVLRGAGDTLWPAVVQQVLTWAVFLPLAYALCFVAGWGLPGAWWAGVVNLVILSVLVVARYRGSRWHQKDIFGDRTASDG